MDQITLHSDASWHAPTRSATWGVLLDTGAEQLPRSGYAPFYTAHATHAELAAVVAGLEAAVAIWPGLRRSTVRTDCDNVCMILNGDRVSLDPIARHLLNRIRATGIAVDARWVRSHQDPAASPEAAANDRCDRMARYRLAQLLTLRGFARPTVEPVVPPATASATPIDAARQAVRAGLLDRFGSRHVDLRHARAWAAKILGRRGKVRVSWLEESELGMVLDALREPMTTAPHEAVPAEGAAA